jgi:hypothetical protein
MTLLAPNMREELIGLLSDLAASEHQPDQQIAFPGYGFDEWFNRVNDFLPKGAEAAAGVALNAERWPTRESARVASGAHGVRVGG